MKLGKILSASLLSLFLAVSAFIVCAPAQTVPPGFVGTQTCINCHSTWLDNDPPVQDVIAGNATLDYVPLNLLATHAQQPFYTIPEAYTASIHNIPSFNITTTDFVKCEGCHGSGAAHFGVGPIPVPIPDIATCTGCHNEATAFPSKEFLKTIHANKNNKPSKYYDQGKNGAGQAKTTNKTPGTIPGLALFKQGTFGPTGDPVSRNERIEECSVCHNYPLTYPQFIKKISQNNMPKKPTVGCGACHDSHIPAPDGLEPAIATNTVQVVSSARTPSGSIVITSAALVPGRPDFYLNLKPYKIRLTGNMAQDQNNGTWVRGSEIARPSIVLASGVGTLGVSGENQTLTFAGGGFQGAINPLNTVFISGQATGTANLPADAINAGQPVTVQATINRGGFEVTQVLNDNTLVFTPAPTVTASVTYNKTGGGTATLSVSITLTGSVTFEVRNMYTNTENLCGSCHAHGNYKFSVVGMKKNGTSVNVSATHNQDVMGQYLTAGHASKLSAPFEEFSAFVFATTHQSIYPFDLSLPASTTVGSTINGGNRTFVLTQTPSPANAFLGTVGNTTLPVPTSTSIDCFQCHHGLGSIDFQNDVQATPNARILWGDATVTCITCHDTHEDKINANLRIPVKLSFNPEFVDPVKNPRGGIDTFMDGTVIPSGVGDTKVCLFCHQGRESGLTVFLKIKKKGVDPYTNPNAVIGGISFVNAHYLDGGSLVWSRNAFEYFFNNVPQQYFTGIPKHQELNCTGCHMAPVSANGVEGGHTWRPQVSTCVTCHPGITSFTDIQAQADYNGNGVVETTVQELGTISDDGTTGSGLFFQLVQALNAKGIFYSPGAYPYFFDAQGATFTGWTSNTLSAAFNLGWAWKAGNCTYYHNAPYVAEVLLDSLKALGVTKLGVRPVGSRPATDYRTIVINP
jgi:hypothetical protein